MAARKLSRKQRRALAVGRAWNKTLSRRKRKLRAGKPKRKGWSAKVVNRRTTTVDTTLAPIFGVRTRRKRRRKVSASVTATVSPVRAAAKRKRRKATAAAPVKRRKAAKRRKKGGRKAATATVYATATMRPMVLALPKKASPRTITTPAPVYMDRQVAPPRSRGLLLAADNQLEAERRERRQLMAQLKGIAKATSKRSTKKKKTGTQNPGSPNRMSWWIADVHIKNGKRAHTLCFIGKGSQAEAAANARKLMMKHKAVSVELAGPYGTEPSPHAVRR